MAEMSLKFGRHNFSVNTQELELSIVPHEDTMCFHLSGTAFFEPVENEEFLATRDVWDQQVVSENARVYRAEWLAWQMIGQGVAEGAPTMADVHAFMAPRLCGRIYQGRARRGCAAHSDGDVCRCTGRSGLLRFGPRVRALAMLFWEIHRGTRNKDSGWSR